MTTTFDVELDAPEPFWVWVERPRFDDCYVPMGRYVAVDAPFHMMLEVCAEMRRHGVDEVIVAEYRRAAIYNGGGPFAETPRWVRVIKVNSGS